MKEYQWKYREAGIPEKDTPGGFYLYRYINGEKTVAICRFRFKA